MKADLILEAAYALVLTSAAAISVFIIAMALSATCDLVGERAPSPSHGVTIDTPRPGSEAAPARSLADGNGEDVVQSDLADFAPRGRDSGSAEPASTVTQSALQAVDSGNSLGSSSTSQAAIAPPPPATPVATSRTPETLAPKSINSYDPWPAYLWPVVECLIQRESRGDPYAVGAVGERGLLQIHPIHFSAPYNPATGSGRFYGWDLFDGPTNIRAAYELFVVAGGLRPWNGGCA